MMTSCQKRAEMDTFTAEQRSEIMSRIRSTGTTPENQLFELTVEVLGRRRKIVRNAEQWEGKPDIWIPSLQLVFFADGCFFHGCPQHCRMPATNRDYWEKKIARNQQRDRRCRRRLRQLGFAVWRFWEHDLKKPKWDTTANRIERAVNMALDRRAQDES